MFRTLESLQTTDFIFKIASNPAQCCFFLFKPQPLYLYSTATTEHHLQAVFCPEVRKVRLAAHTAQLEGSCTAAQKQLASRASQRLPVLLWHSTSLISNCQYLSRNTPLGDLLLRWETHCIKYPCRVIPLFFKQTSPLISPGSLL